MTANETYQKNRQQIEELIALLESGLVEMDSEFYLQPTKWGKPEQLGHVATLLKQACFSVGAMTAKEAGC